jgi:sporulation protein YlmC with PRC-barrel domain
MHRADLPFQEPRAKNLIHDRSHRSVVRGKEEPMKKFGIIMAMILASSLVGAAAYAGTEGQSTYDPWGGVFGSGRNMQGYFENRASTIIGTEVQNKQGDYLGKITDLMVDPQDGRIAFAVLSHGGILGIVTRFTAVPFSALTPGTGKRVFLLDASKEKIVDAPTFSRDQWPNVTDREWSADTAKYYGQAPYWEEKEDCSK